VAYEYYKQQVQDLSHDVFNSVVPTDFERNGDFSAASINNYFGTTLGEQGCCVGGGHVDRDIGLLDLIGFAVEVLRAQILQQVG
jgi:hypothetical protein